MAKKWGFEIKGSKETERMFLQMPDRVQRRIIRKGVNAYMSEVRKILRQIVPRLTGDLKRAIASKTVTKLEAEIIYAMAGGQRGKPGTRHIHLMNNGFIAADGSFVAGAHFIERAHALAEPEAQRRFGSKLGDEIIKEFRKLGYKA